jgi:hypothetical protein
MKLSTFRDITIIGVGVLVIGSCTMPFIGAAVLVNNADSIVKAIEEAPAAAADRAKAAAMAKLRVDHENAAADATACLNRMIADMQALVVHDCTREQNAEYAAMQAAFNCEAYGRCE